MKYEDKTPTHNKFGVPMDALIDQMPDRSAEDGLTFDEMAEFLKTTVLLVDAPDSQEDILQNFSAAVAILRGVAEARPEIAGEIKAALENLTLGVICATNEIACQRIEHESKTGQPIYAANEALEESRRLACDTARELWGTDHDCELMIGYVAELVHADMQRQGRKPPKIETVRRWISQAAPDYARKGGRPKKL